VGRIVVRSVNQHDPTGHGGNRRLTQIIEVLERWGPVDVGRDVFWGGFGKTAVAIGRGAIHAVRRGRLMLPRPKTLRNEGVIAELVRRLPIGADTVLVLEAFLHAYLPLIEEVRRRGGRVVMFPQNLDSLTPGAVDPMSRRRAPVWMHDEINVLRLADLVCCISREEQWLLALFGVQSLYLPFYPAEEARPGLRAIRERRRTCSPGKILIMGSVVNGPTLAGMQALVANAGRLVEAARGRQIVLAGFGTEVFRSALPNGEFRVLGSVSEVHMTDLLCDAAACVCYQLGTTGALTRIPQLLCAGVPVLANYVAARTYYGMAGLIVTETLDHLLDELRAFEPFEFDAPAPPTALEEQLLRGLRAL